MLVAPMKPISLPLPFLGLTIRIEAAHAARRRAAPPPITLARDTLKHAVGRRVLQDVGLDNSRQD
jgi:hypothetical protein